MEVFQNQMGDSVSRRARNFYLWIAIQIMHYWWTNLVILFCLTVVDLNYLFILDSNIFFNGTAFVICILLIIGFKANYKRMRAEQEAAAQRILGFHSSHSNNYIASWTCWNVVYIFNYDNHAMRYEFTLCFHYYAF